MRGVSSRPRHAFSYKAISLAAVQYSAPVAAFNNNRWVDSIY